MAWINVHEDVVGPKLRNLAKLAGCSRNEALGNLILIWLWGIKNANQSGLIKSADKEDVANVIASGLSKGLDAVKFVDSMVESGWIEERGGELYLHDWDEWQEMWYQYLRKKEKDTTRKREAREKEREADRLRSPSPPDQNESAPHPIGGEDTPTPPVEKGGKSPYPVGFERFWSAYPRRVDKGNAYKKYTARKKDGFSDEELIAAAISYAAECKSKRTETDFIKHPKTFLSDAMPFTDFLPKDPETPEKPDDGNPYEEWRDE